LNGAVVALLAVHFVQLQFFARIEVTETPVNRKIFSSLFLFTVFFLNIVFLSIFQFFLSIYFSYYTYWS